MDHSTSRGGIPTYPHPGTLKRILDEAAAERSGGTKRQKVDGNDDATSKDVKDKKNKLPEKGSLKEIGDRYKKAAEKATKSIEEKMNKEKEFDKDKPEPLGKDKEGGWKTPFMARFEQTSLNAPEGKHAKRGSEDFEGEKTAQLQKNAELAVRLENMEKHLRIEESLVADGKALNLEYYEADEQALRAKLARLQEFVKDSEESSSSDESGNEE